MNTREYRARALLLRGQAGILALATGVSLMWQIFATTVLVPGQINPVPAVPGFVALVIASFLLAAALVGEAMFLNAFVPEGIPSWGAGPHSRVWRLRLRQGGLVVLLVFCAVLLGWATLPTGGAAQSPYGNALLAIALLSPFVVHRHRYVWLVLGLVAVVYVSFSGYSFLDGAFYLRSAAPALVVIWTTLATAIVAIAATVAVENIKQRAAEQRRPLRVLWVDDNPEYISEDVIAVEAQGWTVEPAATTDVALRWMTSGRRYDLLITDLAIHGGVVEKVEPGRELIQAARRLQPDLPAIIYTSVPSFIDRAVHALGQIDVVVVTEPLELLHATERVRDRTWASAAGRPAVLAT